MPRSCKGYERAGERPVCYALVCEPVIPGVIERLSPWAVTLQDAEVAHEANLKLLTEGRLVHDLFVAIQPNLDVLSQII